jgi:hypothetical protein
MIPGTNPTEKVEQKKVGEKSNSWYFGDTLIILHKK